MGGQPAHSSNQRTTKKNGNPGVINPLLVASWGLITKKGNTLHKQVRCFHPRSTCFRCCSCPARKGTLGNKPKAILKRPANLSAKAKLLICKSGTKGKHRTCPVCQVKPAKRFANLRLVPREAFQQPPNQHDRETGVHTFIWGLCKITLPGDPPSAGQPRYAII